MNKYLILMRFDKPIGIYLLLYPTLWALFLVGEFDSKLWVIFIFGVVLMRSAGCVINDFADRKIDKLVERTKNRPITSGEISPKNALILFATLILVAFILVIFTNMFTIFLAFIAGILAIIYPFSKRFFVIPQLFLGVAFAMSVLMVFSAYLNKIPLGAWWIFAATVVWTVIYDTMYAMSDRDEDLQIAQKIGKKVNSSAIFFGKFDKLIIGILQTVLMMIFIQIGNIFELNIWYFGSIFIVAILSIYQQILLKNNDKKQCFQAFLNNNYLGFIITLGIVLQIFTK